jgi:RNA polymerase sigma-70 factor (ECF subfamily)
MNELDYAGSASPGSTRSSLLERAKARDADAWQRLVSLYGPLVYHWCRRQQLTAEDTADLFQEVFRAVATHLSAFRKDRAGDTFRGWLLAITRNKIRDHFRRRRRQPQALGGSDALRRLAAIPDPLADHDEADSPDEQRAFFRRALQLIQAEFEERTWQAFWRVAVEGWLPGDVAAALRISLNAVYKAKARVLRRLRQELGELLPEDR